MLGGFISGEIPQVARWCERRAEADVRITMLGAPLHCFGTQRARNPHRRMWLLIWQSPRIDVPIVKMLALVAPRSGPRPGLHDEVVGPIEHFAIVCGVGVIEELLAACPPHP